jgi:hypothetical protein
MIKIKLKKKTGTTTNLLRLTRRDELVSMGKVLETPHTLNL